MDNTDPGSDETGTTAGPGRRRMILPALVGAGALVLGGVAFVAAGASAQDSTASPSATSDESSEDGTIRERMRERLGDLRRTGGHHRPGPMGGGPLGGGIHGEFVVPDQDGTGYRTVLTQSGEVTAVTATSITVRSEDDYTHTYVVSEDTSVNAGRDGIGDVEVGHDVRLLAVREGGDDSAVHIGDLTRMEESGERWGFGHGPLHGPADEPADGESGAATSGLST